MDDLFAFDAGQVARIAAAVRAYEGSNGAGTMLPSAMQDRNYGRVSFYNNSGMTIPAQGVIRVSGTTIDDEGFVFLNADQPNSTFQNIYLVNGTEDVEASGYGWGTWLWHAGRVLYDNTSGTPALGESWGPASGQWSLKKNRPGFGIAGGNNATLLTTIAVQDITTEIFGLADAAILANASGTVRVYGGTPGSETDTGQTIASVFNNTGATITDEQEVKVKWLHGKPYLEPWTSTQATPTGIPFYNGSSEVIPPFAVMYVIDEIVIAGVTYLDVIKPTDAFDIYWLVNGDTAVNPGATSTGYFLFDDARPVIIGSSEYSGTINPGDELGPFPGSWGLWPGRPGFTAVGEDYDNTLGLVRAIDCKQRSVTRVFGRLYSTLTQNALGTATAQFEIWHRNTSGARYPAGWSNVTVFGTLMNTGDVASAGTFGYADYSTIGAGYWEVDPACDPDNTNTSQTGYPANQGWQPFTFSGPPDSGSTQGYGGAGTGTGTF